MFPSPLGELWIWIRVLIRDASLAYVSVPARGIMNLNAFQCSFTGTFERMFPSPLGELWIWILCVWLRQRTEPEGFRPRSGNYESEYDDAYVYGNAYVCFRPRSGNYESELCDADKDLNLKYSFRPRSGNYESEYRYINRELIYNCFRPRSGNYESELKSTLVQSVDWKQFPSPLGELWIWIKEENMKKISTLIVSVPARGIMNLNLMSTAMLVSSAVSVPARGIMNLNAHNAEDCELFVNVSVPARGIMNLNPVC